MADPLMLPVPEPVRRSLADRIRAAWGVRDPEPVVAALPRELPEGRVQRLYGGGPFGRRAAGRLDREGDRLALEVLEEDRMGPARFRLWEDGTREDLETEATDFLEPRDPGDREAALARWGERNARIADELRARGFYGP